MPDLRVELVSLSIGRNGQIVLGALVVALLLVLPVNEI